ncbi:MAG: ABC transporter ATP-binding protein [Lactobacillaceae bacterium]|jgi:multiple sugar transport system ATP-binding protein|nr:ABC transporter ATP-binding protein [Lactobacillaceae bacterium]
MPEITLEHLQKIYPGQTKPVISDYSLDIHDKEFVVFIGPSGSGKSTVLRMIAGLHSISSGTLKFDNRVVNDVHPKDRDIAMVFQDYALYPHLNVYENIAFPLRIAKVEAQQLDDRVRQTAELMGLSEFLDRKPADLSGGQRQRVAIAGAIVRGSKILLMDEPLSNLDAKLRVQARKDIADIHKKIGSTTIYVTHDQGEAMTLADKIVLINFGDIQQIGSPEELYNKPANLFVATFMGSPEMNVFEGIFDGTFIDNQKGLKFKLPKGILTRFKNNNIKKGEQLYFGVRPEDIDASAIAIQTYDDDKFTGIVTLSELIGESSFIHFDVGNTKDIVAKIRTEDKKQIGQEIELTINMSKVHFFKHDKKQKRIGQTNE